MLAFGSRGPGLAGFPIFWRAGLGWDSGPPYRFIRNTSTGTRALEMAAGQPGIVARQFTCAAGISRRLTLFEPGGTSAEQSER